MAFLIELKMIKACVLKFRCTLKPQVFEISGALQYCTSHNQVVVLGRQTASIINIIIIIINLNNTFTKQIEKEALSGKTYHIN